MGWYCMFLEECGVVMGQMCGEWGGYLDCGCI